MTSQLEEKQNPFFTQLDFRGNKEKINFNGEWNINNYDIDYTNHKIDLI